MRAVFDSAIKIADDIRSGVYSSREIVQAYISRIEGVGAELNAVVARRFEQALAEADDLDRARAAGRSIGPLHGVPMTVKESFDVAGLPSTFGHPERATHRARSDSVAVSRLVAAGAVILGKTNVPKDLADWQTFNGVYGKTVNPWDPGRSPGGSSGGAAAALAAGLSALELGSDIAGSIRVPAVYCGVWGHKPTFGVVSMRGHGINEQAAPSDILVGGPLARTAADLELAFDLISGADEPGGSAWHLTLPCETRTRAREFRFAIVTDDCEFPVDHSIRGGLERLAACLKAEGAVVDLEPELPVKSRQGYELFLSLLRAATSARFDERQFVDVVAKARTFEATDRSYDALMHRGLAICHRDWLKANDHREELRHAWRAFFQRYDALICPTTTTPAFPHMIGVPKIEQFFDVDGTKRPASDNYYWIGIPSLCYLPATAVPLGETTAGLPVGAQIIGPEFADKRCLRLARLLEASFRSFRAPPTFAKFPDRLKAAHR